MNYTEFQTLLDLVDLLRTSVSNLNYAYAQENRNLRAKLGYAQSEYAMPTRILNSTLGLRVHLQSPR